MLTEDLERLCLDLESQNTETPETTEPCADLGVVDRDEIEEVWVEKPKLAYVRK